MNVSGTIGTEVFDKKMTSGHIPLPLSWVEMKRAIFL